MTGGSPRTSVAVIVPVFNRLDLLKATVDSLRAQTLGDAEFILVDDRSDEDVWEYLQTLPAADNRFRILRKPDGSPRGCQESRNLGLDAANAEAVMFLDSDDLIVPDCLEQRYGFFSASPEADIVVGRQAGFTDSPDSVRWINVASDAANIDRFLNLTQPLDVPWINGGVIIRTVSLREAKARWRPEYHWDDVAFHFECLVSGLTARWMPASLTPDSYYRRHGGERYGRALFTPEGMRSSARMLDWIYERLQRAGLATEDRRIALAGDFFHACLLRAIDSRQCLLAGELIREARGSRFLNAADLSRFRTYLTGRKSLSWSPRLTYYWNRIAERSYLAAFFSSAKSTYSCLVPENPASPILFSVEPETSPGAVG